MMESRRALIVTLAGGLLWMPRAAAAQPPSTKTARIGYLAFRSGPNEYDEAFRQGLRELGYIEGRNIVIENRYADEPDQASALAAELVRLKVDVIVAVGANPVVLAAQRATKTIPIVFQTGNPIGAGLVTRLDRPGGNLTGLDNFMGELNVKRLELLKEAVPSVSRVAVLANPARPATARRLKEVDRAAQELRIRLHVLEARERKDIDGAFAAMTREQTKGLLVLPDTLFTAQHKRIVDLATTHRVPGIFFQREFAEAGGLLSYSPNLLDIYRRLARYVDKILKGAKAGDLPIEQPARFELILNLKTAKALGLTVPGSILLRADKVIE